MTEMTAFERRIADGMLHRAGPIRPVDDLAVFEAAIAANRQKGWGFTMFSALKFIAAGVIVALFGGFLLAGILMTPQGDEMVPAAVTESPSPMTTEELLSGMVTEEVEPGVFRVVNDGVRDLASVGNRNLVAGHDGSVWLVGPRGTVWDDFVRLGSPDDGSYRGPEDSEVEGFTVTRDGTVWMLHFPIDLQPTDDAARLDSLKDGTWTDHRRRTEVIDLLGRYEDPVGVDELAIAPDGTLWATYPAEEGDEAVVVTRLGPDGWESLDEPAPAGGGPLVTRSGEVWVTPWVVGRWLASHGDGGWYEEQGSLWRYRKEDGAWREVTVDAIVYDPYNSQVEVGADGTVWFAGVEPLMVEGEPVPHAGGNIPTPGDSFLMRFDGTEWQRWGPADGVPSLKWSWGLALRQAPDGGLWMVAPPDSWNLTEEEQDLPFEGIVHFDGSTWRLFFAGHRIGDWDMAPDGSVWLRAASDERSKYGLYVITPEAVAASE